MEYREYNFEKLEVYQLAEDLIIKTYSTIKNFPKEEIYGITSQIKRAVISIALNIAEGSTSRSKKDFIKFINISIGSLIETKASLKIAVKLNFINLTEFYELSPDFDKLFFKLLALKKYLHE